MHAKEGRSRTDPQGLVHSGHNPIARRALARGSYCVIGDPDAVVREFSRLRSAGLDGLAGNVYCGGAGGIWVMDPHGKKLGRIVHGAPATTNIAFGGDDWKTLYFTSRSHLGSVNVKIAGLPVPTPKK